MAVPKKVLKRQILRNIEYYGLQEVFDELYQKSLENRKFKNLMELILMEENIKLAYRNMKKNDGSTTQGEIAGIGFPEKGTAQGSIISPLLSNVVLNELDWWIASKWEFMPTKHVYKEAIKAKGKDTKSKPPVYKYVVKSHISEKALKKIKTNAKERIIAIQKTNGSRAGEFAIRDYNSFVMGVKNYYSMATCVNPDMQTLLSAGCFGSHRAVRWSCAATQRWRWLMSLCALWSRRSSGRTQS